jgi:DNA-binding PadR family transcriptional regulator
MTDSNSQTPKLAPLSRLLLVSLLEHEHGMATGYTETKELHLIWRATHQQVYREIAKLDNYGMVTRTIDAQEGKPDRKLIKLTKLGIDTAVSLSEIHQPVKLNLHRDEIIPQLAAKNVHYIEEYISLLNKEIKNLETDLEISNPSELIEMGFSIAMIELGLLVKKRKLALYKADLEFTELALHGLKRELNIAA